MIFYSFKNSIKEWIMAQPCLRKIIFRKRVETQKILSRFLETHNFCGYSFVKETIFLKATPTKSEVYEVFINLDNLVNVFLDELTCSKPNLQEIAFSDTITHSNVIVIKYMTTIYKDSLLVSAILFFVVCLIIEILRRQLFKFIYHRKFSKRNRQRYHNWIDQLTHV